MKNAWRYAAAIAGAALTLVAATATPANAVIGKGTNIFSYKANGKCIGISNGLAGLWDCTSNPDQKWTWGSCKGLYCQLKNGNGKCLAVNGGSLNEGARILGYSCTGSDDQYWRVLEDGVKNYIINDKSNKVVAVQGGSTANGAAVVQWTPLQDALDQRWY